MEDVSAKFFDMWISLANITYERSVSEQILLMFYESNFRNYQCIFAIYLGELFQYRYVKYRHSWTAVVVLNMGKHAEILFLIIILRFIFVIG